MSGIGYLALRHILFHRLRSLTLVLVMATLITIPMLAEVLTRAAETRMMARAEATPMIYGATGASLDLTLSAAYFRGDVDTLISMADYEWLLTTRQADLAPIHHVGTTSGFPIIGTDIDYFRLRGLTPIKGRLPVRIGEAVLGADVAGRLGVGVGDTIASDVQQVFNLAGAYPVGMIVSGILAPTATSDDRAVLTDLRTGWIVTGLGHGHEELTQKTNTALLLGAGEEASVTANSSLPTYQTISADRLADFHFHGAPETFPLSAVLIFPLSAKASALIRGRVADKEEPVQILRASDQIRGLMDNVFQVKAVLQSVMLAVSIAALLALALVVWLSVQMRRREFELAERLGARPGLSALLVTTELGLLTGIALAFSLSVIWGATRFESKLILFWFSGG